MAVKRSIKAIPINIPCLFILTNSLDIDVRILNLAKLYINEKTENIYTALYIVITGRFRT